MKQLTALVCAIALWAPAFSQSVTESVLSLRKKYSPLFENKSALLSMEFLRSYDLGGKDTSYYFLISISQTEAEVTSISVGFSLFSLGKLGGGGSSVGANVDYVKTKGQTLMAYEKFKQFYKCINDVYRFVGAKGQFTKGMLNTICICEVDDAVFGGEYLPNSNEALRFYFKLGDSVFTMSRPEFEEIIKIARDSKGMWDKRA